MKAIVCRAFGAIDGLGWEDVPEPPCGPRDVRFRTTVATLGFMDILMLRGLYQHKPQLPYIPGAASAGVVTEVGKEVKGVRVGDRVTATGYEGGLAEMRVVDEDSVLVTPEGMDDVQACGLRLTFTPSYLALVVRAGLKAGETLVVTGATGGIGFAALQLGRVLGARVIGAVGSAAKQAWLEAQGFGETLDYSAGSFKDAVNRMTGGRGADVIFEVIGGDVFEQSLRCIAPGGRVLVLGFASGRIGNIPANLPLLKNAAVIGSFLGGWRRNDPKGAAAMNRELFALLSRNGLRTPVAKEFALADAVEAMKTAMDRSTIGQVVLRA